MPLLWKSQTDFHNSLEISHRTRDSHIPTADPDSYELTSEQAKSVTDVSGPICYRSFRLRTRGPCSPSCSPSTVRTPSRRSATESNGSPETVVPGAGA